MKVIQAGQRVNAGQSRSTEGYAVAALCCCTFVRSLAIKRQQSTAGVRCARQGAVTRSHVLIMRWKLPPWSTSAGPAQALDSELRAGWRLVPEWIRPVA